jgi:cysteine-rich repeat protein
MDAMKTTYWRSRLITGGLMLTLGAGSPDANANPSRDGWGFGIADDAGPERAVLSGGGFRRLETKVFRFQVPYNAGYFAAHMDRAAGKIAEARAAGVPSIMVTFGQGAGQSNPPGPADWRTAVRWFLDRFDADVDAWGVANEPNTGWLAGAHSGNPCLLAGYYAALHAELASRGGADLLVSPEWQDEYTCDGRLKRVADLSPGHPDYHPSDSRTTVQHYIDHYTACGGSFGGAVGWHPYGGVKWRSGASTLDLLAHTPSNLPVYLTEVGSVLRYNDCNDPCDPTDDVPCSDCSDRITPEQQEEEVRWLVENLANTHPRIQRVYYYQQRPPGGCTWDSGLEGSGGDLRPAWWRYCSATHNGACDVCTGVHCDDGNTCTTDSCSAGQCAHTFAPACLAPILSLLSGGECGDGAVDEEETCDDGNRVEGDCCSAVCTHEPAGTACGSGCDAGRCNGSGVCQ